MKMEFKMIFLNAATLEKMKFSIKDFFTFTEEIVNGKLHFLCSVCAQAEEPKVASCK